MTEEEKSTDGEFALPHIRPVPIPGADRLSSDLEDLVESDHDAATASTSKLFRKVSLAIGRIKARTGASDSQMRHFCEVILHIQMDSVLTM